jgi:hypothetical protein
MDIPTAKWTSSLVVLGISHGLLLSSVNFAVQAIAETRDVAYAAAMSAFMRTIGLCVGVTVRGTGFRTLLSCYLRDASFTLKIANYSESYLATLQAMPAASTLLQSIILTYSKAL